MVFDTPFAFISILFIQAMASAATALVRDNFDSISEVKYVIYPKSIAYLFVNVRVVFWLCQEKRDRIKALSQPKQKKPEQIQKVIFILTFF